MVLAWASPFNRNKLITLIFKAAPWDDTNFRFQFCNEVVYPPDHFFLFPEF